MGRRFELKAVNRGEVYVNRTIDSSCPFILACFIILGGLASLYASLGDINEEKTHESDREPRRQSNFSAAKHARGDTLGYTYFGSLRWPVGQSGHPKRTVKERIVLQPKVHHFGASVCQK